MTRPAHQLPDPPPAGAAITFQESLRAHSLQSLLCVGIDPPLETVPLTELSAWGRRLVDATFRSACLYKPNIAFYEARGLEGLRILRELIDAIHAAGFPVLLDAKRGDIASTAAAYAQAAFEAWGADALTVNPLLGRDGITPFIERADRGAFILCHTSNPGARDLQELEVGGAPLYEKIAQLAAGLNTRGNVGLVVGATFPETLQRIRSIAPEMWILLPGVGAQGGALEESLSAGLDAHGSGLLVNVSRAIAQAADPSAAAKEYRDRIEATRGAGTRAGRAAAAPHAASSSASLADEVALGLHDLGAVRLGEFTLKSGQLSPIYIDLRLLVSDPKLMALVARMLSGLLAGLRYDRIAAIPYGGLPIGQATALAAGMPLIYPRREAKDYGTKKLIEGKYAPGETVVVLDDLVTTGGSKLEAMAPLVDAGLTVKDVVVLVDREQGGREELASHGLSLHAALTLSQILDSLVRHGRIAETVRSDVRTRLGIR
jgi:uridine monophosphate synthetase